MKYVPYMYIIYMYIIYIYLNKFDTFTFIKGSCNPCKKAEIKLKTDCL